MEGRKNGQISRRTIPGKSWTKIYTENTSYSVCENVSYSVRISVRPNMSVILIKDANAGESCFIGPNHPPREKTSFLIYRKKISVNYFPW